jgi:hypothetical protein
MATNEPAGFTIEVTNLGIPVTINEVGLSLSPPWRFDLHRLLMMPNLTSHSDLLPFKLDSRQQANFSFPTMPTAVKPTRVWFVYAKTQCGVYARGATTPAFRDVRKRLLKAEN